MAPATLRKIIKSLSFVIIALIAVFMLLLFNRPAPSHVHHVPAFGIEGLAQADLKPASGQDLFAINIFASWCGYCRIEHDNIIALSKHMSVYGIAFKDHPDDVAAYLEKSGDPYTQIGYDRTGVILNALDTRGTPETLIVDRDMNIIFRRSGVLTSSILKKSVLPLIEYDHHD